MKNYAILLYAFAIIGSNTNFASAASICEMIENEPGVYFKKPDGFPKKLGKSQYWKFKEGMKLWIVPDRPKSGLETTWHVKVETLLDNAWRQDNFIKLRRNPVKSTCPQEDGGTPEKPYKRTSIFGVKTEDDGFDVSFEAHDNYVDKFGNRAADRRLKMWHFNWREGSRYCPHTSDFVEKLTYVDGTPLVTATVVDQVRRRTASAASMKKATFTTISSNLVHRNDEEGFCYSIPVGRSVLHGPGVTHVKIKRLPNSMSDVMTINWDN